LLAYIAFVEIATGHIYLEDFQSATDSINFAIKIGAAIAIILLLGVAREALEIEWKFARIDPLTGALSRKAFFEAVAANNGGNGEEVLIFADVNDLKRMNDDFGHDAGDAALRDCAARIKGAIRKGDLFARLGGDEFVILCRVQDRSAAEVLAQRIDGAVNRGPKHEGIQLSCSVGVLALPEGSAAIDEELRQADKLMYLAKRQNVGAVMAVYADGKLQHLRPLETNAYSSEQILEDHRTSKLDAVA
jgi:diguanylate cyclase (GGDEF)-like protein